MRVEYTDIGWNEIVTTKIEIKSILLNFFDLEKWLDFNERHPKIGKNRGKCQCCKKQFKDIGTNIALATTNGLNKPLCQICAEYFRDKGVNTVIRDKAFDN